MTLSVPTRRSSDLLREIDDLVERVVPGGLVAADVDRRLRGLLRFDRQLAFEHVTSDRLVVPVDVAFLGHRQGDWLHLVLDLVCLVEVGLWKLDLDLVRHQWCRDHRSEERRVGKECVSTCRSRWWPCH